MANANAQWTGDGPFIVARGGVDRQVVYRHPEESNPRNVKRTVTVYYCVACAISSGVTHQMAGDDELADHVKAHGENEPVNAPHAAPSTQVPLKHPNEGMAMPPKFVDEAEQPLTPPQKPAAQPQK